MFRNEKKKFTDEDEARLQKTVEYRDAQIVLDQIHTTISQIKKIEYRLEQVKDESKKEVNRLMSLPSLQTTAGQLAWLNEIECTNISHLVKHCLMTQDDFDKHVEKLRMLRF